MRIRKLVTLVEEILEDGGKPVGQAHQEGGRGGGDREPVRGALRRGPPGRWSRPARSSASCSAAVAALGAGRARALLRQGGDRGVDGEYEHAAAILHPTLGTPFRAPVDGGKAIIPSAKKLGGPGTTIDVPLHYKDAAFVRTHFDAMEVRVKDAPRANEILVALVVTDGGPPHPRVGGLTVAEARREDGLR